MSYSSLFVINKRYKGKKLCDYHNSWLFSPIVWQILEDKYFTEDEYGMKPRVLDLFGKSAWSDINNIMNNSENTDERICWELSNQQIFFTRDKNVISDGIVKFISTHQNYGNKDFVTGEMWCPLKTEHIKERFMQIASDIKNLDEVKYPCFVFKNTSVDDWVDGWFYYDEKKRRYKTLKDVPEKTVEFVTINNSKITGFIDVAEKVKE